MVEPCCNTYAPVVRAHPIVYSTGQMICTIPILARQLTPARDRKIVKRCEPFLRVSFGVVQRVSSVQLVAPTHLLFSGKYCIPTQKIEKTIIWCYQLATSSRQINHISALQMVLAIGYISGGIEDAHNQQVKGSWIADSKKPKVPYEK